MLSTFLVQSLALVSTLNSHVDPAFSPDAFRNLAQVVRTAYDKTVEGQSVVPTRGFGDLYYKQNKDGDGNLLPPEKQV